MIISEKINQLRREHGWSQEELAEKLGVSRQAISKWENGSAMPDIDKVIKLSELFDVSTDYLLHEEYEPKQEVGFTVKTESVSIDETNEYMDAAEKAAPKTAWGVAFCILSAAVLMLCLLLEEGALGTLKEEMAAVLGVCGLLVFVAIGVFMLVSNSMKLKKYERYETEEFTLDYGVKGIVEKRREAFASTNAKCVTTGVVLCILSAIPVIVTAVFELMHGVLAVLGVAVLLCVVAVAVWLFVYAGCIEDSFKMLLQIEDYTAENKRADKKLDWFYGTYWLAALAIYLGNSFTQNNWEKSWIVWPIAGVLFGAAAAVLKNIVKSKEK